MRIIIFLFFLIFTFEAFAEKCVTNISFNSPDSLFFIDDSVSKKFKTVVIKDIILTGNKVTKNHIIFREIMFGVDDSLKTDRFDSLLFRSRENLLNTSLFNFVSVNLDFIIKGEYSETTVTIDFIERWYIWPFPIFELAERNFNSWWKTKDFSRANYGFFLTMDNFRGRMEKLKILVSMGYDEKYEFSYQIPYINKKQTLGFQISTGLTRNHETSVITINDTLQYFKSENSYPKTKKYLGLQLINRPDIHNSQIFEIKYNQYEFSDSLLKLNPFYTINGFSKVRYFSFYYQYKSDFRDYKPYPLNGYYFDFVLNKSGFNLFKEKLNVFYVQSTFREYWKLCNRFYFAYMFSAKFSSDSFQPYFAQEGLGYGRNFPRSYEYYVIDGQDYGLLKTNFKFELIPEKVKKFGFIPSKNFNTLHFAVYLNIFADLAYITDKIYDENNTLSNELLFGTGIGLDLVTYYDIVWRLEYSINKMHESGFFVHFMAPL
ncbi:MAG: hypothetical protein K9J13_16125 [Saprospiraceae bacterium]|nr:hypothetical protein [Saprospiraceae bacterium]